VLARDSTLFEAYQVLMDLAYWENDPGKLEEFSERALELEPDSAQVIERYLLGKKQSPAEKDLPELFFHYSYDHFSMPYVRNWHMLTIGGNIPVKQVILSPYLNGGYMAGVDTSPTDLQMNLDAYFNLGKKNYALAGYGVSPNGKVDFLPQHRAVAELWQVLTAGFALSAGLRYFYWEEHFTFLTFSAEKYAGNFWFSLRNYLFFKDYGISGSYYLSGRRYFTDRFDHLTLTLGYGTAPDEPLVVVTDLDRMNALSCRLELSKEIGPYLRLITMVGYAYEEFADREYRNRFDMRVGFNVRLKR
jgi:YaiO family outer membrane protein